MGVSWGLDRIGLFTACELAIIGAEDVRVSIVACGLATLEIGEFVISASWGLDRIGLFIACELAIIGAEDEGVSFVACGLATFEIGEGELFTACELAIIGRKDMGVSIVALVLAAFEVGVSALGFAMICLAGLVVLITLGGGGKVVPLELWGRLYWV